MRHESFACHTKILLTWAARVALPSDRLILMLVSIETQWCHALLCSAVTIRIQVAPEANVDSESPGVSVNGNGGTPIAGWFISWKIRLKRMISVYSTQFRNPPCVHLRTL